MTVRLPAGVWVIDPRHSLVTFAVRHLMSRVRGEFTSFEGVLVSDGTPTGLRASGLVDLNSVDTRDEERDAHLRSRDFFGVEESGPMRFVSTEYDGTRARGLLTIRAVTRPVVLEVAILGTATGPDGERRVGVEATTEINRKDFGIDFNIPLDGGRLLIGDRVSVLVAVEAVLDARRPAT